MSTQTDVYRAAFALLDALKGEMAHWNAPTAQAYTDLGRALTDAYADQAIEAEYEHDHIGDERGAFRGAHSHEYQEADDHYHASEDGGTAMLYPGR